MNIYCPASLLAALYPALLRRFESGPDKPVRMDRRKPLASLAISDLRCLFLRLEGHTAFTRTPYVFPLLLPQLRDSWRSDDTPPETRPNVDWLYLGGPAELFAEHVGRRVAATGDNAVTLYPYLSLRGPLGQTKRENDVPLTLKAVQPNLNQASWESLKDKFLELPEAEWKTLGCANVLDFSPSFLPLIEAHHPREPRRILDLGCGLGQTARSLAARYPHARVTGLDASREAIEVARTRFSLPNLDFAVFDISDPLPEPPGSVDVIVSANALSYALNQGRAARELFGRLSPDGLLLNVSRLEESNMYFDFPRSLLLPTNHVLQLADWLEAAAEQGIDTRLLPFTLGFGPSYFHASGCLEFMEQFPELVEQAKQGLTEHAPFLSHGLLIHARGLRPGRTPATLPIQANYLERLETVLLSLLTADDLTKDLTIVSWIYCRLGLELGPEFLDFCAACLPRAGEVVRAVLDQAHEAPPEKPLDNPAQTT